MSLLNQDIGKIDSRKNKISFVTFDWPGSNWVLKRALYIAQNIVTIFNIIHHNDAENILAIMISIDFEKAFDKLEWNFIFKCLDFFLSFPLI